MSFIFGILVGVIVCKMEVDVERTETGEVKQIWFRWGKVS